MTQGNAKEETTTPTEQEASRLELEGMVSRLEQNVAQLLAVFGLPALEGTTPVRAFPLTEVELLRRQALAAEAARTHAVHTLASFKTEFERIRTVVTCDDLSEQGRRRLVAETAGLAIDRLDQICGRYAELAAAS